MMDLKALNRERLERVREERSSGLDRTGIWANHEELYPIPVGFKEATCYNDVTPHYSGFNGRCDVWMHDAATLEDVYGDANNRPLFLVEYHGTEGVYGLSLSDEGFMAIHLETWQNVLQLLIILKCGDWFPPTLRRKV